ncbi:polysaccharide pyruvyl transferase family protein [Actinomyces sp. 594]|uniref:polysaccharide pyruvyl transferase family protein n=1 Tax=Actinomyces sp. 594 TaxID=2057793 RepID=UPI001C578419|nr:polysaccharide pyruvyl transferase family protein [Actinomyces sp. 594]MBW3069450.1 polysaccharide pyruvyl transferase family protein [Actinomyces sp. 594]
MRILILWASLDQPNLGVRALAVGTRALAAQVFPGAEVQIQGTGHGDAPTSLFMSRRGLLKERVTGARGMFDWLASFDLVLDTRSGDSFADIYGLERLRNMSRVPEVLHHLGVPLALTPQTIGPFNTRRGRVLARRALQQARLVASRDRRSAACAAQLGRPVDVESTDVVFAIDHPPVATTRDVVLNVSGLLWNDNPHVDATRYRRDILALARRLQAEGRTVTLLAHVVGPDDSAGDNDRYPLAELRRELGDVEAIVPQGPDALDQVRAAVGSARVVLGSRMHACLNALSMGTPAVPLAYSRKFAPLLAGIGWDHVVELQADDVVDRALAAVASPRLSEDVHEVRHRADRDLSRFTRALGELL